MMLVRIAILALLFTAAAHAEDVIEEFKLKDGRTITGSITDVDESGKIKIALYMNGKRMGGIRVEADDILSRKQVGTTQAKKPAPESGEPAELDEISKLELDIIAKQSALDSLEDEIDIMLFKREQLLLNENRRPLIQFLGYMDKVASPFDESIVMEMATGLDQANRIKSQISMFNATLRQIRLTRSESQKVKYLDRIIFSCGELLPLLKQDSISKLRGNESDLKTVIEALSKELHDKRMYEMQVEARKKAKLAAREREREKRAEERKGYGGSSSSGGRLSLGGSAVVNP